MTEPLMFDPKAAGALAATMSDVGAAFGPVAGRLRATPAPGGGDPWRADPALAAVTGVACARLLAVASEFDLVALALRAAVVSYRAADDRAVARFAALSGRAW